MRSRQRRSAARRRSSSANISALEPHGRDIANISGEPALAAAQLRRANKQHEVATHQP